MWDRTLGQWYEGHRSADPSSDNLQGDFSFSGSCATPILKQASTADILSCPPLRSLATPTSLSLAKSKSDVYKLLQIAFEMPFFPTNRSALDADFYQRIRGSGNSKEKPEGEELKTRKDIVRSAACFLKPGKTFVLSQARCTE
nr:uncharacterized protein LOC109181101 [Ipomoea batatas]